MKQECYRCGIILNNIQEYSWAEKLLETIKNIYFTSLLVVQAMAGWEKNVRN